MENQEILKALKKQVKRLENERKKDLQYICDELCKHPEHCNSQEELDEICAKCRFGNGE